MTQPNAARTAMSIGTRTHGELDGGWTRGNIRPFPVWIRVSVGGWGSATLALARGAEGIGKHGLRTDCVDLPRRLVAVHQQQGRHMSMGWPSDGLVRVQPLDIFIVRRDGHVELQKRRKDGGMGVGKGRREDGTPWGRFDGADTRGGFVWY